MLPIATIIGLIPTVIQIVKDVESLFGPGTGDVKKPAAVNLFEQAVSLFVKSGKLKEGLTREQIEELVEGVLFLLQPDFKAGIPPKEAVPAAVSGEGRRVMLTLESGIFVAREAPAV